MGVSGSGWHHEFKDDSGRDIRRRDCRAGVTSRPYIESRRNSYGSPSRTVDRGEDRTIQICVGHAILDGERLWRNPIRDLHDAILVRSMPLAIARVSRIAVER